MNPSKVKLVKEDEHAFEMHDGSSPFKVPKKGLSKSLEERIRSMSAVDSDPSVEVAIGMPRENSRLSPLDPEPVELSRPPPVSPIPLGMSPEEKPYFPPEPAPARSSEDTLAALRGKPGFDERAYQAALNGQFPSGGAEQYKQTQNRAVIVEQTLADRAAAGNLGIKDTGAPAPTQPPAAPPAEPIAPPRPRVAGGSMPGMAAMKAGVGQQQAANAAGAEVKAEEGRQTADALSGLQRQLEANALEDKVRVDAANARVNDVMSQYKAAQDEMRNVNTTVDPGRYWASRSTGGKIAGIIGLALGALGTGPDGINRAAAMMNQAIDRDLDAQKAEHTLRLQKGKSSLDAAQSAYAMEHTRFGDEASARAAAKANLLGLAQNKLSQITAGSAAPAAIAQRDALNGALEIEKGKLEQEAANALATRTQHYAAAEAARAKPVPGAVADKTALTEIEGRNQTIHESGRKLLTLIDAYGTGEGLMVLGGAPGVEGQMRQLANDMAVDAAKLKDPNSVARPGEVELELQNLFEPGWMQRSDAAKAKIKAFLDNAEDRRATAYRIRGMQSPGGKK